LSFSHEPACDLTLCEAFTEVRKLESACH